MVGESPVPGWLAGDGLLSKFASNRTKVRQQYREFVLSGIGVHDEAESAFTIVRNTQVIVYIVQSPGRVSCG